MYLSRKILGEPLKEIGSKFGGRDHTTVIHACQVIENMLNRDHKIQSTLDQIKRSIK